MCPSLCQLGSGVLTGPLSHQNKMARNQAFSFQGLACPVCRPAPLRLRPPVPNGRVWRDAVQRAACPRQLLAELPALSLQLVTSVAIGLVGAANSAGLSDAPIQMRRLLQALVDWPLAGAPGFSPCAIALAEQGQIA